MKKHLIWLAMFASLSALALSGGLEWFERALMEQRFRLVQRDAGDRLVLVEIDEPSLRRLDTWPWPRGYHARLVERLLAAGAETIAFDIDFSSRAAPADDQDFAAALARAGKRAVLPVFKPKLQPGSATLDETRPLEIFARHARLASVIVAPDSDSRVRRMDTIQRLPNDEIVPTMPALLGAEGRPVPASFYIDFGIRIDTIPRVSYADVLNGSFPAGVFSGRAVLVAATALQLGDILSTPVHVTAPGGVVIALAAESLRQNRALIRTGPLPAIALALLLMAWLAPRLDGWRLTRSFGLVFALSLLGLAAPIAAQASAPLTVAAAPVLIAPWLAQLFGLMRKIERQAVRLFRQRLHVQQHALIMRGIVENSLDAVLVFGYDGRIALHNQAAGELFGAAGDDLRGLDSGSLLRLSAGGDGKTIADMLSSPELPAGLIDGHAVDRHGKEIPIEMSMRRIAIHPAKSRFERRREPRTYHFVTVRDISARRAAEAAQQQALAEARAASQAKSQFLATISHELRTPLNAIIGFSEILKGQMFGPLGHANYRQYAGDIHLSGQHLLDLINDILDVTRVDLGEMKLEETRVNLAECAQAALRLVAAPLGKKHLAVLSEIPAGFSLLGDPRMVKQILVNLLSNAVKFTPEGGRVTVTAERRADGGITVKVADTGIGIPKAAIANLGRPFYQVDQSHTRRFEGVGLGLSIVAGLMKLHNGSFTIDSTPGVGTTVACHFPSRRYYT
ncbi:MAG: CHASE2 domain-containing protein [Rhodospirillales bacterium]